MSEIDYNQAKFIDGYDNYLLFANGNILNCDTDKWLKHTKDNGYIRVGLRKNKKRQLFRLHQLLAQAFITNPENKEFVDHINHIKDDNRIENLRWVTLTENQKNRSLQSNTSGFRGVSYNTRLNAWFAQWNDLITGKRKSKSFAISKHGFIPALKLAVLCRYQMEKENDYLKLESPDEFFRSNLFLNMMYEYN